MKPLVYILILCLSLTSCKPGSKTDVHVSPDVKTDIAMDTAAVDTTSTRTSTGGIEKKDHYRTTDIKSTDNQVDTSNYDRNAAPSKKYQAPKANPRITAHECSPNFNMLSKSQQTTHFYYVTDFKADEFKCWAELEKHGVSICNDQPCIIYYLDSPNVNVSTATGNQIDANTLMKNGIGKFEHSGKFWEVKGARIWKRSGKEFGYYNSNNQLGG